MKSSDQRLVFCIFIFGILLMGLFRFQGMGKEAIISRDGEEIYRLSLQEETHLSLEYNAGQTNEVVIRGGKVSVSNASCPDQLCVHQGKISKKGETIVCLPHKLVIEIK